MSYPAEFPARPVRFVDIGVEAPEAIVAIDEMVEIAKSCFG